MEVARLSAPLPEHFLLPHSACSCCTWAKPTPRIQLAACSSSSKPPPVPTGTQVAPKAAASSLQGASL